MLILVKLLVLQISAAPCSLTHTESVFFTRRERRSLTHM